MYILMIARGYPTAKHPQWGCFEKDQAEALASIGHKVVVVSFDRRFLLEYRTHRMTRFTHNGITYYNQYILPGVTTMLMVKKHKLALDQWIMGQLLRRVIKEQGKPDVIYGQYFFNTVLAVPTCQHYNIPLVGIEHAGRFYDDHLDAQTLFQATIVHTHADSIIAVSQTLRAALKRHFNIDAQVVHNSYSADFTYQAVQPNSTLRMVTTSSLVPDKGIDVMLSALALYNQTNSHWALTIIGNGPEKVKLQQLTQRLQISDHVHFTGSITKQEIKTIYSHTDLYLSASFCETFGVAILEALACGIPVISTICGGPEDFITPAEGLLVPTHDSQAMADAIEYFQHHADQYNRPAIAQKCIDCFSPRVIAQQLTEIFEQTITTYHQSSAT